MLTLKILTTALFYMTTSTPLLLDNRRMVERPPPALAGVMMMLYSTNATFRPVGSFDRPPPHRRIGTEIKHTDRKVDQLDTVNDLLYAVTEIIIQVHRQ